MAPNILNILVFFTVGVGVVALASHAVAIQAPQLYWKSKLPNTPMPKSIRSILPSGYGYEMMEEKSTSVGVGKGGVSVDAGKGKPGGTSVGVGKGGVSVDAGKGKPGGTSVDVGKGGVNVDAGKGKGGTKVGVGKGGVSVSTGGKGKPVNVGVKPGPSPFLYNYAASQDQLHDNPDVALFFLEKDLHEGSNMNLHFTTTTTGSGDRESTFVPRQVAQSMPFSSAQLPQILRRFSVSPGSLEAQLMEKTIKECEEEGIKGEDKYCATSLESMIDFTTSKLGTNVEAVSTQVEKVAPAKQKYTVRGGVKEMKGEKAVVCHKQEYAYAVFYCHTTESTKAYKVPLEGADGTRANAVAVCHTDTSAWNPKHLAFQLLNIKPGTSSVCHFLPQNHLLWLPNY